MRDSGSHYVVGPETPATQFFPGDKVRVEWMGAKVTATVVERLRPTRPQSPRIFYRLSIPGVKGRPIYEQHELVAVRG